MFFINSAKERETSVSCQAAGSERQASTVIHSGPGSGAGILTPVFCLDSRISELMEHLQRAEVKGQTDSEALLDQLQELTSENTAERLENQSLKVEPDPSVRYID